VNKAKTLKMKLIYVIAAVAMLAMLIPAMAVPAFAAGGPAVSSVAASLIGDTTATLNGSLTALGVNSPVSLSFVFGKTSDLTIPYVYSNSAVGVPPSANNASTLPLAFSANISGLDKNATYYFRAVADNGAAGGKSYGPEMTFSTGHLTMQLVDPITGDLVDDGGYNVSNSTVQVGLVNGTPGGGTWSIQPYSPSHAHFVGPGTLPPPVGQATVRVQGDWGEAIIVYTLADGSASYAVDKKWGQMTGTVISGNQSLFTTWNESGKRYEGAASVTDTVTGNFINKDGAETSHVAQGVILNWFLVAGDATVPILTGEAPDLIKTITGNPLATPPVPALAKPKFTTFGLPVPPPVVYPATTDFGTSTQTVTGANGASSLGIYTSGAETVKVVVIAEYPFDPQFPVTTEVTTVNFKVRQLEVVPQVRWVGEKIVLEKNFGVSYAGYPVQFTLENQSPGTLEGIHTDDEAYQNSVDSTVQDNGLASCILKSDSPGEVNVELALRNMDSSVIENQHAFTVYYLKFAGVTLGNVQGKRDGHDSGLWTPPNPWDPAGTNNDPATPDEVLDVNHHNVSADTLLRARVRGWFTNANRNPARMTPEPVDTNLDGTPDLVIPEYAWVLPDDWANPALMGASGRIHWDIMDNPFDSIVSADPKGPYGSYLDPITGKPTFNTASPSALVINTPVAANPVVGPFSPGIELMTPTGWLTPNPRPDTDRLYQTVVPNGKTDMSDDTLHSGLTGNYVISWDAPMPPAKVTFQIQNAPYNVIIGTQTKNLGDAGYFKPAMKTDIYYLKILNAARPTEKATIVYTSPFYFILVPAHEAIPAFGNDEAYDWATFGTLDGARVDQGPYPFWTFVNTDEDPAVKTIDAAYPTIASVYSDNHGEAMVWLNGNWNLNLSLWTAKGGADVPYGYTVGETLVRAIADYPYARGHANYVSNQIEKVWDWGGEVLGTYSHSFADFTSTDTQATRMVLTAGNFDTPSGTFPYQDATSKDKVVWVWATDRDGQQDGVLGAQVDWNVKNGVTILDANGSISTYNDITTNTILDHGFLAGTAGTINNGASRSIATSSLKSPKYTHSYVLTPPLVLPDGVTPLTAAQQTLWRSLTAEEALFYKFFNKTLSPTGLQPDNFACAAIDIYDGSKSIDCTVEIQVSSPDFGFIDPITHVVTPIGKVLYETNVNFANPYPIDDSIKPGDANLDNQVNMGDVTVIEKMILGLKPVNVQADVNCNGKVDMGDVVKLERQLLGLK
jgi:hypothetical protein